jgi:outer membrane protein TolC
MRRFLQPGLWPLLLAVCFVLTGCSTQHYRKSADKEAYGAIVQKTPLVKNMEEHFTIEQTNQFFLEGLPATTNVEEFLGRDGELERGARVISLEQALDIAVNHSRIYQGQKEQLFLAALGLTLARHQFAPIFSAGGNASYNVNTAPVLDTIPDPTDPTGKRQIPVISDKLAESRSFSANGQSMGSILLSTGARLSASFTSDFFRYLSGDPGTRVSSHLLGTLIQPLWRGAGYRVTMENLTQSERNLLYALRNFTLFRKRFSVDVATAYYRVLQSRDVARNSYINLQSSRRNADRTRALAREGRVTQADLGRLEQQELLAESQWIASLNNYKQDLDSFKIQLGLSTDANIVLDDRDLEQLKIVHPDISVEESTKVALATRLDYENLREQFEDAGRKIGIAADALKAQVDLVATAGFDSRQESSTRLPVPDIDRYNWSAGLNLNLPLERKAERNAYRASLITYEAAKRTFEQQADQIKLDVRNGWRALDQAKRNYEINEIGVKLAERRVEEQNLLAELGRARAQDQVDAQNALNDSKNQLTQALVSHTIARLQFWNNLGILYIKDNGQWEEVADAKSN